MTAPFISGARHVYTCGASEFDLIICLSQWGSCFSCCQITCLHVFRPLHFLHKNDVRFVFYSICYIKGSYFNFICIHLRILVPNTISLNSNVTGVTSGTGTADHSGAPSSYYGFAQSLVSCVLFCRSVFVVVSFGHCIVS